MSALLPARFWRPTVAPPQPPDPQRRSTDRPVLPPLPDPVLLHYASGVMVGLR